METQPHALVQPGREIQGISATLLPFSAQGIVDEPALEAHIVRTAEAGLTPAVNMDTGYVHLLDDDTRRRVLQIAANCVGNDFVAGAFVKDRPGDPFDLDGYARGIEMIAGFGGTPVIFQSYGLVEQSGDAIAESYRRIASRCDRFIGFELTTDLGPFGKVYDLETYRNLMEIPQCIGAKHSSFRREPEWQRLQLRDEVRADFRVFTGNDFAIDMVMYGSDYLLGLATFDPQAFALRDRYWKENDPRFYELNDLLQYLGRFAFRDPGPGYKHTAAQFLKLRGWIGENLTHPQSPSRPDSDIPILEEIARALRNISSNP